MIVSTALNTLSFPWMLLDNRGRLLHSGQGALFASSAYSIENVISTADDIAIGGWGVCPNGYAIHKFTTPAIDPGTIVLHGLKVVGVSTAKGRSEGLSINLSQEQLSAYVREYCSGLEALDDQYRSLIRQNIHEVRGINSALYNAAYEVQESLDSEHSRHASISKSVVLLSELLRGRVDFMDFIANPSTQNVSRNDIAVYRKFDKVQRCFRVTANKRGIEMELNGTSTKTINGPPIFDVVPYLLIDNAVKYSPDKRPIKIICNDTTHKIVCSVTSVGPQISNSELKTIFLPGRRGENAIRSKKEGSGLGLSVLRKIVEDVFTGTITVTQSDPIETFNNIAYCNVSFEISLPISKFA